MDPAAAIVVLITAASTAEARKLADLLVEEQLASCVQILPSVESIYRWKGNVERASEVLLLIKTVGSHFQKLEERVREVHSYETPEIVAIPVTAISLPYFEWLGESVDAKVD